MSPPAAPPWRRLVRWCLAALALVLAVAGVAFAAVFAASRQDQRRAVDAIVVLGAAQYNGRPSPVFRARLDHAHALYREGHGPTIVVTGGTADGDSESEAEVGRRYLMSLEVPSEAIVLEPAGRSTAASLAAVGRWAAERGRTRLLLVSDPFHMLRLRFEARRVGLEPYTSPTTTSPISGSFRRELPYLLAETLKVPVAWMRSR